MEQEPPGRPRGVEALTMRGVGGRTVWAWGGAALTICGAGAGRNGRGGAALTVRGVGGCPV